MSTLIEHLLNTPSPLALTLIALLVFGEAAVFVGFVLPGETAVLLGGVLASIGNISLPLLLAVVVTAAILGDTVGYEVGRHFGTRILTLRPLRRHRARLDVARTALRERGGWAVFFGRFTAFLRAAMPGLAGISTMPYPRFLAYNAAGGLVWGVGFTLLGYFAGESYTRVERFVGPSSALLITAFVVTGVLLWNRRRRKRSQSHPRQQDGSANSTSVGTNRQATEGRCRPPPAP